MTDQRADAARLREVARACILSWANQYGPNVTVDELRDDFVEHIAKALAAEGERARATERERCAKDVEKIGHDLMAEHGSYDAATNVWEVPARYADYIEALDDAVEAIRREGGGDAK